MSRKFWLAILIGLIGLPAFADYVDVLPGDTHPNCLWQGNFKPVPGKNCPAGSQVFAWPILGDGQFAHYSVVNGKLQFLPPPPPKPVPPQPQPDPTGFQRGVMADTNISNATKLLLATYFPTISANPTDGAILGPLWTSLKNTGKITPNEVTLIEGYSRIYLIPLIGAADGLRRPTILPRIETAATPQRNASAKLP